MRGIAVLLLLCLGACSARAPEDVSRKYVVFFSEFSAGLDDPALATIGSAAQVAQQHPGQAVFVTGFADPTGSQQANIDLSRTRAQVVIDQLAHDGVGRSRIKLLAHGPTDFSQTSQESRRVEIAVAGT